MRYKNIIFDLDGTLIDSAPAILNSINESFKNIGIRPTRKLDNTLIGPPITEIFASILLENQSHYLNELLNQFRIIYDNEGYKKTKIYNRMDWLLNNLREKGHSLHIATNKRRSPTTLLLRMLNWDSVFKSIYTLDTFVPPIDNKIILLKKLLLEQSICTSSACFVGDSQADGEAAILNNLEFFMVGWGYDGNNGNYKYATTPETLSSMLQVD